VIVVSDEYCRLNMSPRDVTQLSPGTAVSSVGVNAGIGVISRDEAVAFSATTASTALTSTSATRAGMPFISTSWSET
jgi:hypothetical protein